MHVMPFLRRLSVGLVFGAQLHAGALATPADVAPTGWDRAAKGENVIYRAPGSNEMMIFRYFEGAKSPHEIAEAASAGLAKAWQGDLDGAIREGTAGMAIYAFEMGGGGQTFVGRSYAFEETPGRFFGLVHVAPAGAEGLSARIDETERKMAALAAAAQSGDATAAETVAKVAPAPEAAPIPDGLEAMLMTYAYGVGSISVKTHYLFDDGRVCSCTELAPNDAAASLANRDASEIGAWQADGARYRVKKPGKDEWKVIKKPLRAAALPEGWRGSGTYRTIDSFGGVTSGFPQYFTGVWSDLTLSPDGTFSTGGGALASGSDMNVSTTMGRKDAAETGTYQIDGFTLTLRFGDGREERTSIAWDGVAKEGEDPFETIWIRGSAFKRVGSS
ncbi:MAG: hypothetical protein AAGA21_20005 [Pseudomonadota bacterium]